MERVKKGERERECDRNQRAPTEKVLLTGGYGYG